MPKVALATVHQIRPIKPYSNTARTISFSAIIGSHRLGPTAKNRKIRSRSLHELPAASVFFRHSVRCSSFALLDALRERFRRLASVRCAYTLTDLSQPHFASEIKVQRAWR